MVLFHINTRIISIVLLCLAIFINQLIRYNPMWFGYTALHNIHDNDDYNSYYVYTNHPLLDNIIKYHKFVKTDDIIPYKNHCLRVLTFARYYYQKSKKNSSNHNSIIINERDIDLMAIALAYHDIDLFLVNGRMNYVPPSAALAVRELQSEEIQTTLFGSTSIDPLLNANEIEIINQIILQHHKITAWKKGLSSSTTTTADNDHHNDDDKNTNEEILVNAVRMGDWTDFSLGFVRFHNLPASYIEKAYTLLPESGFHAMLLGMGNRLSPNSFIGQFDVLQIFKW